MKTVNALKNAQIFVDGKLVETIELKNPCQMWKNLRGWAEKYGHGVRILVVDANDKPYKDFTAKELKNGKYYMVNSVKETNRWAQMKAKGIAPIKGTKKTQPKDDQPELADEEKAEA